MPYYFNLVLLFLIWFAIWLHHIVSGGCVSSKIEQRLIGDSSSFVDPFLEIFHIPVTPETTTGLTIMGSTFLVIFLGFEVLSRSFQLLLLKQ